VIGDEPALGGPDPRVRKDPPVRSGAVSSHRLVAVGVEDSGALPAAVAALLGGGSVVLPTDTVYGLAALPSQPGATEALCALKGRDSEQALAVLVADEEQARALFEPPAAEVRRWMRELWPGPLTLVMARAPPAQALALGGDPTTIGIRCPNHDFVRHLAAQVGPVAVTSANRHGVPTPETASAAAASLTGPVDLVIDGGPAATVPSTVVDVTATRWQILRQGALPESALA